jgi:hypothetical protein
MTHQRHTNKQPNKQPNKQTDIPVGVGPSFRCSNPRILTPPPRPAAAIDNDVVEVDVVHIDDDSDILLQLFVVGVVVIGIVEKDSTNKKGTEEVLVVVLPSRQLVPIIIVMASCRNDNDLVIRSSVCRKERQMGMCFVFVLVFVNRRMV